MWTVRHGFACGLAALTAGCAAAAADVRAYSGPERPRSELARLELAPERTPSFGAHVSADSEPSPRAPAPAPSDADDDAWPTASTASKREEPGGGEPADDEPQVNHAGSCDPWSPRSPLTGCSTPREGVLSGFYAGADVGYAKLNPSVGSSVGAGPGFWLGWRLGAEFWDVLGVGVGLGLTSLNDRREFSQMVVDCPASSSDPAQCGDPYSASSNVTATVFTTELAVQKRFRPWRSSSFVPGVAFGYQLALSDLSRGVACDGCQSIDLAATAAGAFVCPYFRATFGTIGNWATIARMTLYVSGDLAPLPSLGVEYGFP